jgi:GNAT superfamily N-acetyltransferase
MGWEDLRIDGTRVRLRPARDDDVPAIAPWYDGAEVVRREATDGILVITRAGADEPIGLLRYRAGEPAEGCVTIGCVVLAGEARRRGLGADAVQLFEEAVARRYGVRHFRAGVNAGNGLALYFWLRLGYRPSVTTGDEQGAGLLSVIRETGAP